MKFFNSSVKRAALVCLLLATALLAGGWFFSTRRVTEPAYESSGIGGACVSVRFEHGSAAECAARTSAEYRSAGWDELSVSTRTFKLFSRNNDSAAILAEELPAGETRLTEYRTTRQLD